MTPYQSNRPHLPRAAARAGLALSLALLFAGCATKEAPSVLVALPSPSLKNGATPAVLPALTPSTPTLIVGRMDLPEYWQSRAVRFRGDGATVGTWPDTYWAERVEVGVSRHLAIEMSQAATGWLVCDSACDAPQGAAWRLKVVLPQLDYHRAERRLEAFATWTLLPLPATTHAGYAPVRGQQALSVPAGADTPQAQAEAMARLVHELAVEIGLQLPKSTAFPVSSSTPATPASSPRPAAPARP